MEDNNKAPIQSELNKLPAKTQIRRCIEILEDAINNKDFHNASYAANDGLMTEMQKVLTILHVIYPEIFNLEYKKYGKEKASQETSQS